MESRKPTDGVYSLFLLHLEEASSIFYCLKDIKQIFYDTTKVICAKRYDTSYTYSKQLKRHNFILFSSIFPEHPMMGNRTMGPVGNKQYYYQTLLQCMDNRGSF
jgi:hypothetical protein